MITINLFFAQFFALAPLFTAIGYDHVKHMKAFENDF